MDSLTKGVKGLIIGRTEIHEMAATEHEEYEELEGNVKEAEEALTENLNEKEKELFEHYVEQVTLERSLVGQLMYVGGLKDGMRLLGMVNGSEEYHHTHG